MPEDSRAGMVATVTVAVLVAVAAVAMQPAAQRGVAVALVAVGAAAGLGVGWRLPARRPQRTPMERLNDVAFSVVVVGAALLLSLTARPWTAILPGLALGFLVGRAVRGPAAPGTRAGGDPAA